MRVTFLIGNGFDLHLGLKTRFIDVFNEYVKEKSTKEHIIEFKESLEKDAPDYTNWADFEMGMAEYAKTLKDEKSFIDCVHDFRDYMQLFLKEQEKSWIKRIEQLKNSDVLMKEEFQNSLDSFFELPSRNIMNYIQERERVDSRVEFDFITFNYTQTLDSIIASLNAKPDSFYYVSNPLHIHGTLNNDILLGVDNEEQLKAGFNLSKKTKRAFIKPYLNNEFDQQRVKRAITLISQADIICVYGFSLGDSDLTWKQCLKDWLKDDSNHHLIYYYYNNLQVENWQIDEKLNQEDDFIEVVLEKLGFSLIETDDYTDQVHVPIGHNIFNFDKQLLEKGKPLPTIVKEVTAGPTNLN